MERFKCYDTAVCEVLDEATKRFSVSRLSENEKKRENIRQICEEIDKFAEEFDGKEFFVKVDDESCRITLELTCEEIEVSDAKHSFYPVTMCAESIEFRRDKDSEDVIVSFVFPGIWE